MNEHIGFVHAQFNKNNLASNIRMLFSVLSKRRKIQFILIFFLNIFSSFAELLGLSALMPFLMVLTNTSEIISNRLLVNVYKIIPENLLNFKLVVTLLFVFSILISALIRYFTLYLQTKYGYAIGLDILRKAYDNVLNQPYTVHLNRNTSEVIATISIKIGSVIQAVILSLLSILNSILVSVVILLALLYVNTKVVAIIVLFFSIIYIIIIKISKRQISRDSKIISVEASKQIQILQEGLGGIRDIILTGTQKVYVSELAKSYSKFKNAQENIIIRGLSPKYLIESFGIIFIAILAYFETINSINTNIIPSIGVIALGSFRILPLLQQAYVSVVSISGCHNNLKNVLCLLFTDHVSKDRTKEQLSFQDKIEFKNIAFKYQNNSDYILKNITLQIPKGSRCGIIGKTGSGKSTFLDLLMGLLQPTCGSILVDGVDIVKNSKNLAKWQNCISHVPQEIFLKDAMLKENIAFGVPKEDIDYDRLIRAVEQAQLASLVSSWKDRYNHLIGEGGSKLSGGQRQRIGIARALYLNSQLMLLDEATSALDFSTERDVMKCIENLQHKVTVVIIAHRTESLSGCDFIFEFNEGTISHIGNYNDYLAKSKNN